MDAGRNSGAAPGARYFYRTIDGVKTHWVAIPFFVKVDPRVVKNNEPHKIEEIGWFTIDNLPEPLHSGFAYSFEYCRDYFEKYLRV